MCVCVPKVCYQKAIAGIWVVIHGCVHWDIELHYIVCARACAKAANPNHARTSHPGLGSTYPTYHMCLWYMCAHICVYVNTFKCMCGYGCANAHTHACIYKQGSHPISASTSTPTMWGTT